MKNNPGPTSELQKLKKDKKRLENSNKKLKQRKKQLEEKIDSLKEENRRLLHEREESEGGKEETGIKLPSDTVIKGDIESEKQIEVGSEVRILGSLRSENDIILGYGNQIDGDVISEKGDVKVGNATEIGGIIKGEKIRLAEGVRAGQIKGKEKIDIDENCEVSDLFALGDLNLGTNVKIDGTLRHAGELAASRGITITDSVMPQSKEELEREADETMSESLPSLPMIIREGFGKDELGEEESKEEEEEEEEEVESVRDKIEEIRSLLKSAREENVDILEERNTLKEGVSLLKRGENEQAEDKFTKCKLSLEEKLESEEISSDDEVDEEESEGEVEETETGIVEEKLVSESEETSRMEKEEIIEKFQEIQGVGPSLARDLYEGGFHSVEELREASESELLEIDGIGKSFANRIKDNLS
ncbi:MAG: hypothetical protein KGY76_09960 [Candidatus Thermoplasmatota archaeon]|nr:hypothetical protein [Candidatus Thermoplasmatota archaeon]